MKDLPMWPKPMLDDAEGKHPFCVLCGRVMPPLKDGYYRKTSEEVCWSSRRKNWVCIKCHFTNEEKKP